MSESFGRQVFFLGGYLAKLGQWDITQTTTGEIDCRNIFSALSNVFGVASQVRLEYKDLNPQKRKQSQTNLSTTARE